MEKELVDREKHLRKEVNKKVEKKLAEKKKELLYSVSEYEDQLDYNYRMLEAKYKAGYVGLQDARICRRNTYQELLWEFYEHVDHTR